MSDYAVQGGAAQPVVIVNGGSGSIGTVQPTDASGNPVFPSMNPVGSHNSGLAIATAQVITKPAGAKAIMLQTLTQNIRYTLDATTPTASVGFQVIAGSSPIILMVPGASIKVIQEQATASLQYQWLA